MIEIILDIGIKYAVNDVVFNSNDNFRHYKLRDGPYSLQIPIGILLARLIAQFKQ